MSRLEELQRKASRLEELKAKAAQGAPVQQAPAQAAPQETPPTAADFKGFAPGMQRAEEQKLVGVGRGLTDIGESLKQTYLDITGSPEAGPYTQQALQERQLYEQTPAGQSIPGMAGRFIGSVAPVAAIPATAATLPGQMAVGAGFGAGLGFTGFRPEETPEARMEARKEQALESGVIGAAVPAAVAGLRVARHPIAFATRKVIGSKEYQSAEKFLKKIGVKGASIGEKTGDLKLLQAERQVLGQSKITDLPQLNEFANTTKKFVQKEISRISKIKGHIGQEKAGNVILRSARSSVNKLANIRRVKANLDFAMVKAASGNGRVFSVNGLLTKLQKDLDEVGQNTTAGINIAAQINRIKRMSGDSGFITATNAQNVLKDFSEMTAGTGKLFGDLDKAAKIHFGKSYVKSFMDDMDASARNSNISKETRDLLLKARSNYRELSAPIDDINSSVLGAFVDKDKATALDVAKAMRNMDLAKASSVLKTLDRFDPSAANVARGFKLQNALDDAFKRDPKDVGLIVSVDPSKFFKHFPDKEAGKVWFKGTHPARINTMLKTLDILGTRAKIRPGGSITSAVDKVAGVMASLNPTFLAINASRIFTPSILRKALMTEKGITSLEKAVKSLNKPSLINSKEVVAAWQFLDTIEKEE